jgi:hypothetical protein
MQHDVLGLAAVLVASSCQNTGLRKRSSKDTTICPLLFKLLPTARNLWDWSNFAKHNQVDKLVTHFPLF